MAFQSATLLGFGLRGPCGVLLAALTWLGLAAGPASAQVQLFADEFERADVISIERDGRDLYGFDAVTGQRSTLRLEIGENVFFLETSGRVGLVLTDRRALALGPGTGFRQARYRVHETPPERGLVEDQVALVATPKRVLGFLGGRGVWIEEDLSPREAAEGIRVGAAVGVVATNRRALGLGTGSSRFIEETLRVREDLESITSRDTLATIRTSRRILVFGALRGRWSEQDRRVR